MTTAGIQSRRPIVPLRPYVRGFAQRNYAPGTVVVEPFVPSTDPVMSFLFRGTLTVSVADGVPVSPPGSGIVGAHVHRGTLYLSGPVDMFAVFFQPAGLSDLFALPVSHISHLYYDLATVIGSAAHLTDRLAEAVDFDCRVRIVETFLLGCATRAAPSAETHAANTIARRRGMIRVGDLARGYGLGVRQFERRFSAAIGMTPKTFARVSRFQSALDAKVAAPSRTWCDIAHDFGYHDQMHLIHDFSKLSGASPGELMANLGDARPPAIARRTDADGESRFY